VRHRSVARRPFALALVLSLGAAVAPGVARASDAWNADRARKQEFSVGGLVTRSASPSSDAMAMNGGRVIVEMRVSPRWGLAWGFGGFGGREAKGFLVGGFSLSMVPDVHFYVAPRSPIQPYLLVGYELGCHYLRSGDGVPKSAGAGFVYSGPSAGGGLDARIGRDWSLRLEARGFALIRGYPDSMLRDAPELASATRWLTGFSVATGVVRSFDL
jgi:hypothetical protein